MSMWTRMGIIERAVYLKYKLSEDILRRAKRQGITSRAFRYLALIRTGIK